MHVHRHLKTIAALTALTTIGALVGCSPYGRHAETGVTVSAQWDSGPLDRDYARERADLDTRHRRELATPERGESKYDMDKRQVNENNALEFRYKQGKESHATELPPS